MSGAIPQPALTLAYRLEAQIGELLDLGETHAGRRRIAHLTAGRFSGPALAGELVAGASADWQLILPDGTAVADIRYTLRTDDDVLIYVRNHGLRHGPPEVIAALAAGQPVDPSRYYFRGAAFFETSAARYAWLTKHIIVCTGEREPATVKLKFFQVL